MVRKRLSDISNLQPRPKLAVLKENSTELHHPSDDLINRLLQEKSALLQLVEESEKVLELRTNELRSLQLRYRALLLQNRSLAQSHSQMFAEVNSGRDRLKALQHGVLCKDALLKAKSSGLEGKQDLDHQEAAPQVREEEAETQCQQEHKNGKKPSIQGSETRATRSQSMAPSTSQVDSGKEKAETKRRCLRRQSARFIVKSPDKKEAAENLSEIEDASEPGSEEAASVSRRPSSMGRRPVRKAAVKVQSYKEPSLSQKMRRPK